MQKLFFLLIILCVFSCAKNTNTPATIQPATSTPTPDTLTSGWSNINSGVSFDLHDIFFVDLLNGFACGDSGIIKSTDGGFTWTKISSLNNCVKIAAINSNKAIFARRTDSAVLFNNGIADNAIIHNNPANGGVDILDAFYTDNNICYLASGRYVWKSSNGGISFDSIYNFNVASSTWPSISFINNSTGWIFRNDTLYKTINGGANWTVLGTSSYGVPYGGSIEFIDQNNGFAIFATDGIKAYKTVDGGLHFTRIFLFNTYSSAVIDFVSPLVGYISGDSKINKTIDGGSTWNPVVKLGNQHYFNQIYFVDENHGWVCGNKGFLLRYSR